MRSIQTKFILLILGCISLSAALIGAISILNSERVVDENSARIMNLTCSEKAVDINALLTRIEQSTSTLAFYAKNELESVERLRDDPTYRKSFTQHMEEVSSNIANTTDGAISVYIRFNPKLTNPTAGFFWRKERISGEFKQITPTDLSLYSPDQTEHVGWYYTPVKKNHPTWLAPYTNRNINVHMISYVIPLYVDNQLVGVVGMDINFDLLAKSVADIQVYENGYAFLVDNYGNIMFHKNMPYGTCIFDLPDLSPLKSTFSYGSSEESLISYDFDNQRKKLAFRSLHNNMRLAITAPADEIDHSKNMLVRHILIVSIMIAIMASALTVFMSRRITRPLRELTDAAQKIAAGDFSVSIKSRTNDEVGKLAESFQTTVQHLQKYISYINSLAYKDSLTGVNSKAAYTEAVAQTEQLIAAGIAEFAVLVADLNHLKYVNDHCGHDFGDTLIKEASNLLCNTFYNSSVYRIGGDEFVIIIENQDYSNYLALLENLDVAIADFNNQNPQNPYMISIAIGVAVYQPEVDTSFFHVFKRADEAMYKNKSLMKTSISTYR